MGSEGYAIHGPPYEGRPGRRRVARCGDTDWEQDKANAHLIAQAPALLDELRAGVEIVAVALTALERSTPADRGYGEIEYRKKAMADGIAWLRANRLLVANLDLL